MSWNPLMAAPCLLLLFEQDSELAGALAFALEAEGFTVMAPACDGVMAGLAPASAAGLVIVEPFDGLSGLETLTRLRRRGLGLPAVLIVEHRTAVLAQGAARLGASLLGKPLDAEALLQSVHEML